MTNWAIWRKLNFVFFYCPPSNPLLFLKKINLWYFSIALVFLLPEQKKKCPKKFATFGSNFVKKTFYSLLWHLLDWISRRCHPARFHKWGDVTRHHRTWGQLGEINLQVRNYFQNLLLHLIDFSCGNLIPRSLLI